MRQSPSSEWAPASPPQVRALSPLPKLKPPRQVPQSFSPKRGQTPLTHCNPQCPPAQSSLSNSHSTPQDKGNCPNHPCLELLAPKLQNHPVVACQARERLLPSPPPPKIRALHNSHSPSPARERSGAPPGLPLPPGTASPCHSSLKKRVKDPPTKAPTGSQPPTTEQGEPQTGSKGERYPQPEPSATGGPRREPR